MMSAEPGRPCRGPGGASGTRVISGQDSFPKTVRDPAAQQRTASGREHLGELDYLPHSTLCTGCAESADVRILCMERGTAFPVLVFTPWRKNLNAQSLVRVSVYGKLRGSYAEKTSWAV